MTRAKSAHRGGAARSRPGTTLVERKSLRRAALVNAAFDIIGEEGSTAVTVRALCRRTELTARYFYESFDSRDELIVGMFAGVANEVHEALAAAVANLDGKPDEIARATIEIIVDFVVEHPRKARLLLVEPFSDPALSGITIAQVPAFTRLIRHQLPTSAGKTKRTLTSVGLAGGLSAIFSSWLSGSIRASREEIVEHCVSLLEGAWIGGNASGVGLPRPSVPPRTKS
ncbi:TetR/AcrR family transcriptional regulator [Antrihabitans sp. YC2-6]|uniref:TetR/AcrR family transcriptional regulator n=1 Tax=Antrihabitans sp. YC2-6 TaxID=2799498 RepID=UPI0018F62EBE|nr:TetR family transcriptional regulator [Antrihabitans sp. YC2-6]MBJ8348504.1 TetR/AcrR family transcriptional regulator [Antrihabitans sp. YC2-6]